MIDSHKNNVNHQAELLLQMFKTFHITETDKKYVSSQNSPVVYDVMHAIYIYFKAVDDGDLEPMLDFMIDGEYAEVFKNEVWTPLKLSRNPHVLKSDIMDFDNLYLFWADSGWIEPFRTELIQAYKPELHILKIVILI